MSQLYHEILIVKRPTVVFDYVTRPDLWHEWHPASQSATLPRTPLQVGDEFDEVICISYPFFDIQRATHYRVTQSDRAARWEAKGTSSLFDLTVHYDFEVRGEGTLFMRTLTYTIKGLMAVLNPLIVRPRMRYQSVAALQNLKHKLESKA